MCRCPIRGDTLSAPAPNSGTDGHLFISPFEAAGSRPLSLSALGPLGHHPAPLSDRRQVRSRPPLAVTDRLTLTRWRA
jgi:hypothetical protein